ncbi:tyrosine-type recombinase/integrase [Schlesneria sp. T3-172]|uniref:tyrosine-type recombinase/integrase n=1 Tax=Schlesneria sphaerica TaxID=3373610 RepID=UPI0037C8CE24
MPSKKTTEPQLPKGFSLYPRANGQYAKKIRGKLHYFGVLSNPEAAWSKYLDERDDLQAGRTPKRTDDDRLTLVDLCDYFLANKESRVKSGELSNVMFHGYKRICLKLLAVFGKQQIVEELRPADFERLRSRFAKGVGLVTLANRVQHARVIFNFASSEDLIDRPLKFGESFKKPKARLLRAERQSKPERMFEASEIRDLLATAKQPLKAMVLLGINCGFGQMDCSRLRLKSLDLDGGWVSHPRSKTAIQRRCPLWPETVESLREVIAKPRAPHSDNLAGLIFITKKGSEFVRVTAKGTNIDGIAQEFGKILRKLELAGSRRGFYSLRHSFETIGGGSKDQVAVDSIMGHAPPANDMSSVYRERVEDTRLLAVTNHIHAWLWPKPVKKASKKQAS